MDILELLTRGNLDNYSRNYDFTTKWLGDTLFTKEKTRNLIVRMAQLSNNGSLPKIAKFSSFDAEAPIGSREDFTTKTYQKLLIKEKLPTSETAAYLLDNNVPEQDLINYIYDDPNQEIQRVLARVELANMTVLATGSLAIDENNIHKTIDYGYKSTTHNKNFSGWADPTHSIISDIDTVIAAAKAEGKLIRRAVTSSKMIGYMIKNEEIIDILASVNKLSTEKNVRDLIKEQFGIEFAVNDDLYKVEGGDTTTHRFFPENVVSWFGDGEFGKGLFAPTPDEIQVVGSSAQTDTEQLVYLKAWKENDPSTVWTMGSAVYLPLPLDIDNLFISVITG